MRALFLQPPPHPPVFNQADSAAVQILETKFLWLHFERIINRNFRGIQKLSNTYYLSPFQINYLSIYYFLLLFSCVILFLCEMAKVDNHTFYSIFLF